MAENTKTKKTVEPVQERLFDPAPNPAEMRKELENLIVGDLLGPAGGENEVLPGKNRVRDRYIAGMLAPKKTVALEPERKTKSDALGSGAQGSDDSGSDDSSGSASTDLFPSSIGLSFTVGSETTELLVTAEWGQYLKQPTNPDDPEAGPTWLRHPIKGSFTLLIQAGELGPFVPASSHPDVIVRGKGTKLPNGWLVSLFLVNDQTPPAVNLEEAWMFQVKLAAESPTGAAAFLGRDSVLETAETSAAIGELEILDLQYRNRVEFAVGHGTATHVVVSDDPCKAVKIETSAIPRHEVAVTEAPDPTDASMDPDVAAAFSKVVLDMSVLASFNGDELVSAVTPLVDAYELWLERQASRVLSGVDGLDGHGDAAELALHEAQRVAGRLREGIALLASASGAETDAAEAFRFANHAMWKQRVHTIASDQRRNDSSIELAAAVAVADIPVNRSWRPFQLAFILLNLPSLTIPNHPERSQGSGLVDLLFFPTGGGKTEAYLGLTAFTLAIRRLQGTIAGHDGGGAGVAVLMRYTLRLLTAQQFERAAALMCACELRRRELLANDPRWGEEPFRLGMWVGANVTPNSVKAAGIQIEDAAGGGRQAKAAGAVQLVSCPWCGQRIDAGKDAKYDADRWRVFLYCGDPFGICPFTEAKSPYQGIPVVTTDEEIYRLLPSFVISTADKFAQLPWRGALQMLFGRVSRKCERHGYRSPDLDRMDSQREEKDSHNARGSLPKAKTIDVDPLRPPDLIIQDELHLISGPLGTLVGLYETAIDELASWEVDGQMVRPKVIASTATVRRAAEQAHALFARSLSVFPPPVLDVDDSFFAKERPVEDKPGRLYLGICAPGLRLKSAEVRLFTTLLAAAQRLYERYGAPADPWMTLVGYFSALRELAGTRRLVDDEVKNNIFKADRRGLGKRSLRNVTELTSRVGSSDIRDILDELKKPFDPNQTEGKRPIDVLLATNMISVGVDVARLGLMTTVGQPKTTSEYIQATSRVGRDRRGPGLVVTLYNWARPRDLSHYETFEHYHSTFYRQVEALSVTPFSPRALDRGLSAVLVALARHGTSHSDWNPNVGAQAVDLHSADLGAIADIIAKRAEAVTADPNAGSLVRDLIDTRIDKWSAEQQRQGSILGYADNPKAGVVNLLEVPDISKWDVFTCAWSLRETEPTVNLIIDPYDKSFENAPPFVLGQGKNKGPAQDTAEDQDVDDTGAED
jgi:hypothetical protein